MSRNSSARLTAGFLLAACTPGLVCAVALYLPQPAKSGSLSFLGGILVWVTITSFITVPATFLPGVAAYLYYQNRGWRRWWSYALGGALIGWACIAVPGVLISPSSLFAQNFWQIVGLAALFGGLSALTLWFSIHAKVRFLLVVPGLLCAGLLLNKLFR